ncbi:hypothetical protein F4810DRAFT_693549 [Camillea tinctor]|nr:hypothetical protein F4810DRAFT_693549 [Camillea tinctor]
MTDAHTSTFSTGLGAVHSRLGNDIELPESGSSAIRNRYNSQVYRRRKNRHAVIVSPLAHFTDEQLESDVRIFAQTYLPSVDPEKLLRAARVAKDVHSYDEVVQSDDPNLAYNLPIVLTPEERAALRAEKEVLFSERNMFIVILTVSLAAFLQGFVQSSINSASLYADQFGLPLPSPDPNAQIDIRLGATNASPFFFAALAGCWLALPINDRVGRRGAMAIAACLIIASSLGSVWCQTWYQLFSVRIINGIGMGVKAVSTPILASETAVGYWRGSSILAWQLWVAFGIMIGLAFNLIFYAAYPSDDSTAVKLILGAPFVPSVFLLIGLYFCPESPRYYMRRKSLNFNPLKGYEVLLKLRKIELQALRDIYLVYKSIEQEEYAEESDAKSQVNHIPRGFSEHIKSYAAQYKELFTRGRLRNALISSSIVALGQQFCGINILAFYSSSLFNAIDSDQGKKLPMIYSFAYGLINFIFGLPAIRTIDTLGRRKWLLITLPFMSLFMGCGALSTIIRDQRARAGVTATFLYLFAAAYSPGMGPIPFTLASESFPLSHREAGCAFAVAINLLFAGLLSMFFPSILQKLRSAGSLGLFAGLNLVAFILVFLLVEETKRRSLEDLDLIFAVPKREFISYQVRQYLPWLFRRYVLRRRPNSNPDAEAVVGEGDERGKPSLYWERINGTWQEPEYSGGGGDGDGNRSRSCSLDSAHE